MIMKINFVGDQPFWTREKLQPHNNRESRPGIIESSIPWKSIVAPPITGCSAILIETFCAISAPTMIAPRIPAASVINGTIPRSKASVIRLVP